MSYFVILAAVLFLYVTCWFVVACILRRNDVADVAWGLGFPVLAWTAFFLSDEHSAVALMTNIIVTLWGLRLAWHILRRNMRKPEDSRYAEWRKHWKHFYVRSYLQVFLLQGLLLYIICVPVLVLNNSNAGINSGVLVGLAIWIVGLCFESVADHQLKVFLRNPAHKGKLMTKGLWRYSRHPNYFGEVVMWWGIFVMCFSATGALYTVVSPVVITYLLLYVSGVPLLEKKYTARKDFEKYKAQTSVFVPLPPKKV